ncbi:MAG: tetratricopeptide repeat protein [Oscillatoria princeps RMCB-10]|jgi:tetratricopeptide (TPR) repeat protein|nr:tetratricopeptide repeat protein [Oscillatoria princeps RMCB-10]
MANSSVIAPDFPDYYQRLNLQPDWDCDKIRKELLSQYRETQSKVNAARGEKLALVNKVLKEWIPDARKKLTDPEARAKYDRDLAEWKRTAPTPPPPAIPTIKEIWRLIEEGRYVEAIEAGKTLTDASPNDAGAWQVYGVASHLWRDLQSAIYAAEKAISCDPRNAQYYVEASGYYAAAEQWNDAHRQINRAIQLEPNNSDYQIALAGIYIRHEKWDDAEKVLQGVLSKEPSNQSARYGLAAVYNNSAVEALPKIGQLFDSGQVKEGRKFLKQLKKRFEEAQKLAGDDPELLSLLDSNSIGVRRALGVNFFQRFLGLMMDELLLFPGGAIVVATGSSGGFVLGGIVTLGILCYAWIWLPYKNKGQDLSKRLVGMQIVNQEENSPPSLTQLIFRAILKPLALGIAGSAWFFILLSSRDVPNWFIRMLGFFLYPCLHDRFTGTTVACCAKGDFMKLGKYNWY